MAINNKVVVHEIVHLICGVHCEMCPYDFSNGHNENCDDVARKLSIDDHFQYLYQTILKSRNCELGSVKRLVERAFSVYMKDLDDRYFMCPSEIH